MCIVVDVNVIPCVFDAENAKHNQYKPVLDWIIDGKGKLVIGGTSFLGELEKLPKYLKFFQVLNTAKKVVYVDNNLIDNERDRVRQLATDNDFDDPHLIGLLKISGCKLICTNDHRMKKYIPIFFSNRERPRFYTKSKNCNLLCDSNIAPICKPCNWTTNEQRQIISSYTPPQHKYSK